MKSTQTSPHFIQLPSFDGRVPAELAADYILPDTYPDVKRILRVKATPMLISRYVSGKRLEFSGAVDYSVLFSAEGTEDESLHCVHFAGEWESALGELEGLDSADISLKPTVSACTARLSNPRKLTLRSTITTDVRLSSMSSCTPRCEGAKSREEELSLERLYETVTTKRECTFGAEVLHISENLEPDASQPPIDEIVSCDAVIHFYEAKPSQTSGNLSVAIKGELCINCLYKAQGEAGSYRSFSRKLPISCITGADAPLDDLADCKSESLVAIASAVPVEINTAVAENSYGERRILELDVCADVTVCVIGGEEIPVTLDAYSTDRDYECLTRDISCESPSKVIFSNFSVGESISREEMKLPEGAVILDAAADTSNAGVSLERGRALLTANAVISCIVANSDGTFTSSEVTFPVKCDLAAVELTEPLGSALELCITDLRQRADNERVYFDFEVSVCARLYDRTRRRVVETIKLSGEAQKNAPDSALTLCYPAAGDTLWQIAKRYGTTTSALEAANQGDRRVLYIPTSMPHGFVMDA